MKKKYIIFHIGVLLGIGAAAFPAAAASPEFAYSAEKWETLKDNKLEFDEIAEIVHEYNVTVQQNKLDYQDYKGKDSYDFADDYYDSADDLSERTEYPDESNPAYAGLLMSALSSEIQAESLKEMGDNNVDDGEIKKLDYDSAEKQIVKQAQESCALAKTSLDSAKLRLSAGLITAKSYEDQSISYDSAVKAEESAERKLLSAKLSYDWAVSGLAKSS